MPVVHLCKSLGDSIIEPSQSENPDFPLRQAKKVDRDWSQIATIVEDAVWSIAEYSNRSWINRAEGTGYGL